MGRLYASTQPEINGTTWFTVDGVGNTLTVQQPNGTGSIPKTYTYDAANRPKQITYSDTTPTVTYTWDSASPANGIGRLASIANTNSTTTLTYDQLGRPLTSSQQTSTFPARSFAYTFDFSNDLLTETLPSGRVVTTTFDITGRPSTLSGKFNSASTNYIVTSQYWPHSVPYKIQFGNGLWRTLWSVNNRLQPTAYWDAVNDNPYNFLRIEYPNWIDANGNNNGNLISTNVWAGGPDQSANLPQYPASFKYDSMNRLTNASEGTSGWNRTYTYDRWGNVAPSTSNAVIPLAANSPTAFNTATNRISAPGVFNYDNGGNLTAFNGNTLSYNAENQLKSVQGLGISETILYDAAGRRVLKSLSSGATAYVFDAFGNLAAEYANGTTWSRDYIRWGGGQLIATENAAGNLCTTCYFAYDHLGSVRMVTDATATVKARHDYLPYGEEIAAGVGGRSGLFGVTTDTNVKFTGQLRDQESGQDYFNARYLAGVLGRFHSPDPGSLGASLLYSQSWNGYVYALNDPCDITDPAGLAPTPCKFNIYLGNTAGQLSKKDMLAAQNEISRILGTAGLGVNFTNSANAADYSATLQNFPSGLQLLFWTGPQMGVHDLGVTDGFQATGSIYNHGWIFLDNITAATSSNAFGVSVGRTTTHEFSHWALQFWHGGGSGLETNIAANGEPWMSDSTKASFSSAQAQRLQKVCEGKHPSTGSGSSGGGVNIGGGGGGSWVGVQVGDPENGYWPYWFFIPSSGSPPRPSSQ